MLRLGRKQVLFRCPILVDEVVAQLGGRKRRYSVLGAAAFVVGEVEHSVVTHSIQVPGQGVLVPRVFWA